MPLAIITEIEDLVGKLKAKLSPAVQADIKAAENAGHDVEHKAVDIIKTNGLQLAYGIVSGVVEAAVGGTPWGTILSVGWKALLDAGHQITQDELAMLAAQAQADLIALGKIAAPAPVAA